MTNYTSSRLVADNATLYRANMRCFAHVLTMLASIPLGWGCSTADRYRPDWPDQPVRTESVGDGSHIRLYQLGNASAPNYRQVLEDGRITTLAFDDNADGQVDETVPLTGDRSEWPHLVIILDGIPFDVVQAMHEEGRFRLFPPPARVVSVFPAMTDLALARVFHTKPCLAAEALYFDRRKNHLSDGNAVYLHGENAPWLPLVDYHAPQDIAVNTYLKPWSVFWTELGAMDRLFTQTAAPLYSGYSVGTAGVGTRQGEAGIRACLSAVDKLCERITYQRRGKVRFSILADHGHGLQQCRYINFEKALKDGGGRVAKSLRRPEDVVIISYGLVTYAAFYTDRPRQAADALLRCPDADLAVFREEGQVRVLGQQGEATIRPGSGGYAYDPIRGDPLELLPILEHLRASGQIADDGTIDDRSLLMATAAHKYPDPLHRIWAYFSGLVEQPADLIVSLKPDACHGSKFFHFFMAPVASAHGSLDYRSSVTFLLTNATPQPVPAVLRVDDVLDALHVNPREQAQPQ